MLVEPQHDFGGGEPEDDRERHAQPSCQGRSSECPPERPRQREERDAADRRGDACVGDPRGSPGVVPGQQHVALEPAALHGAREGEQRGAGHGTDGSGDPAHVPPSLPCATVRGMGEIVRPSAFDRALRPLHAWVWRDPHRRARKLLRFAETEADGGRDLSRAAELTTDALLRRLYFRHSEDEMRHAALFRSRGTALLAGLPRAREGFEANWLAPGERGLDDVHVEGASDEALLAFLHLSEKAAAKRFALYRQVLWHDPATRGVFEEVLRDEAFHMSYTHAQLERVAARGSRARLWKARLGRIWKTYLRAAAALASVLGTMLLRVQYFLVLPPFALLARRSARREPLGFLAARSSS